jgi:hypothetical protein
VLRDNTRMLELCHELGFVDAIDTDPGLVHVRLSLAS